MDKEDVGSAMNNDYETEIKEPNKNIYESEIKKPNETENIAKTSEEKKIDDIIKKALEEKISNLNLGGIGTQINIGSVANLGSIGHTEKDEKTTKVSEGIKQYKLHNRQECSAFVTEYKNSLHLAYAIAISMFEYVPVSNLQRLSESLLKRFPKTYNENGKEVRTHISPFISLDTILTIIGAEIYKVSFKTRFENLTERCVCFSNNHEQVMENLWEMFPMLRSEITSWLIESDFIGNLRDDLNSFCYVRAMANIVKIDFADTINRLFPQLTSNPLNKILMMRLMLLLVNDENTIKNVSEILRQWSTSKKWLWEISLVVYSLSDKELNYKSDLEKTIKGKILSLFDNEEEKEQEQEKEEEEEDDTDLISGLMVESVRLRNIVSEILFEQAKNNRRSKFNYVTSVIYLILVSSSYKYVNKYEIALPLVAIDNKKQIADLEDILYKIFGDFTLRQGLIEIIEAYLNEIDHYKVTDRLIKQLKSYFYIISKKSQRYLGDIQRFLKRLQSRGNKTAESISVFLEDKLESKELTTL